MTPWLAHWGYCSLALNHRCVQLLEVLVGFINDSFNIDGYKCLIDPAIFFKMAGEISRNVFGTLGKHYIDVIMGTIASQITSLAIVYSIFYSDADQRKHQSSASLAFLRGSHRGPVNSPHK